jgi:zinc and cadmium transporter
METIIYSLAASIFVGLISLVGIVIFLSKLYNKKNLLTALISFAAGTLIGDVFLHLLSENIEEFGYTDTTVFLIFSGVFAMLVIESYLHCSHDSSEEIEKHVHENHVLSKINIIGDGLHNFLDGLSLATSFLISPAAGVATTIAVTLHEIPQELADVAVLSYSGWTKTKVLVVNLLTGLTAVLGVISTLLLNSIVEDVEKYLIPLVVGQFTYIALADLVPEIHKKSGVMKYAIEMCMFILGLFVMYSLTWLE